MADDQARVYLYGVIRETGGLVLDVPPISGDGTVYTIAHRGLAAVVSDGPLPRYEVSRKNVRSHQAVVDGVMRTCDILPTRLGTVLAGPRTVVEDLLDKRWAELDQLLKHVRGRVELGLKVSWTDLQRVFQEVVAGDRGLRALRDRMSRHPESVTYEARIDLGDRAAKVLAAKRAQEADELVAAFEPHVVGVRRNDPISELMVLNAAFLVERGQTEAFEALVGELDRASSGRLGFMLAGPLPPYNFVGLGAGAGS
jgi:hypothetical protein